MDNKKYEWFTSKMLYLEKHCKPGYNTVLCTLAYCHEKQGNQFDDLTEELQELSKGDFKRVIKHIRKIDAESAVPGLVDYIRCRWLGKGDAV